MSTLFEGININIEKNLLGYDYIGRKPDCKEKGFVSFKRNTIT
jgi:hypothetical protein